MNGKTVKYPDEHYFSLDYVFIKSKILIKRSQSCILGTGVIFCSYCLYQTLSILLRPRAQQLYRIGSPHPPRHLVTAVMSGDSIKWSPSATKDTLSWWIVTSPRMPGTMCICFSTFVITSDYFVAFLCCLVAPSEAVEYLDQGYIPFRDQRYRNVQNSIFVSHLRSSQGSHLNTSDVKKNSDDSSDIIPRI